MITKFCVNSGSYNGLLPSGTKPLHAPILTHQRWSAAVFKWRQLHWKKSSYYSLRCIWNQYNQNYRHLSCGKWVRYKQGCVVDTPDSKVHGANIGGPHVGPVNFAISVPSWDLFTNEVNSKLAKHPLVFNGRLANRGLTSLVIEATAFMIKTKIMWCIYHIFVYIYIYILIDDSKMHINGLYIEHFIWNCPQMNGQRTHWWLVNIGSGSGLVSSGKTSLPEPMLA